jgi:undecaprenyl-diphosphatase
MPTQRARRLHLATPINWRRLELRVLVPIALLAAASWAFIKIAGEVLEGDTNAIDLMILQWCRVHEQPGQPIGPVWLQESIRDITALGSPAVLVLAVGAVWGYLMVARQTRMAWLAAGSAVGGLGMAMLLKTLFTRARPEAAFHATVASGYSFPSGHAMMSAIVFLTMAVLVARLAPRTRLRLYAVGMAGVLTLLVGLSRVYLGVHWASDVAGGWAAGAAWAMLCWLAAERLGVGASTGTGASIGAGSGSRALATSQHKDLAP